MREHTLCKIIVFVQTSKEGVLTAHLYEIHICAILYLLCTYRWMKYQRKWLENCTLFNIATILINKAIKVMNVIITLATPHLLKIIGLEGNT